MLFLQFMFPVILQVTLFVDSTIQISLHILRNISKINSDASVTIFHLWYSFHIKKGVVIVISSILWQYFVLLKNEHLADLVSVVSWFSVWADGEDNSGVLSVLVRVAVGCACDQVVVLHNKGDALFAAPLCLSSQHS